ncbi:MAG: hypothetical protein V1879_06225 [Pseudomonadota bacterium]
MSLDAIPIHVINTLPAGPAFRRQGCGARLPRVVLRRELDGNDIIEGKRGIRKQPGKQKDHGQRTHHLLPVSKWGWFYSTGFPKYQGVACFQQDRFRFPLCACFNRFAQGRSSNRSQPGRGRPVFSSRHKCYPEV